LIPTEGGVTLTRKATSAQVGSGRGRTNQTRFSNQGREKGGGGKGIKWGEKISMSPRIPTLRTVYEKDQKI